MALIAVAAVTFHLGSVSAHAAQATLTWKAPTTYTDGTALTTLKGYKIHAGTAPGSYSRNLDVGNVTSYVMNDLSDATTYYFAVTAYDTAGRTSGYSTEAKFLTSTTPSATLYTLTAAPGTGGSISPAGSVVVSAGSSQTYAIAPATGYKIADVKVDGASVGAVSTYTLSNVSANHTIAASFVSTSTTDPGTLTSSGTWKSQAIASQRGIFTAAFDAVPAANNINALTGFSALQPGGYPDVAAIVRFNTSGTIDARNGSSYAARTSIPYSAGKSYRVRLQIDVPNHRYDVWVTPAGGAEVQLAAGYAFRTEQAAISALNYLGVFAATGTHQVQNLSVTAAPVSVSYTLSASATTGGSVAPAGTTTVSAGASKSYTITAATGYKIADVKVDGTSVGAVSSYTFSNVTANHTIAASFVSTGTADPGAVTSSATWKSQAMSLQKGIFTAAFDTIPAANNINAVTGFSAVQPGGYADVAAIVRFNTSGTIDARNGSSYAARTAIPYSAGKSYRVRMRIDVPNHRYDVWVTPAGGSETQLAAGYAFRTEQAAVSALSYLGTYAATGSHSVQNLSVTAAPAAASYTLSASATTGGSVSPSGTTTVTAGGSKSYTIAPATGYRISDVKVDGTSVGAVSSYTFSNVTANHTISATFTATASYTISATAYANGSISPSGTSTVLSGASKSYTITPRSGYTVSAVKVDGVSIGRVTSYTFSNVKANHTIAVSFKLI